MSAPTTADYQVNSSETGSMADAVAAVGAGVFMLGAAAVEAYQNERRRIEAERAQRLSDQSAQLQAGELQWRNGRLRETADALYQRLRAMEQAHPELSAYASGLTAPAQGDSVASLQSQVQRLSGAIKAAQEKLATLAEAGRVSAAIDSLAGSVDKSGKPRRAVDVLPNAGYEATPQVDESSSPLEVLRTAVSAAINNFSTKYRIPFDGDLLGRIEILFKTSDSRQAVDLGMQVRQDLASLANQIEGDITEARTLLSQVLLLPQDDPSVQDVKEHLGWVLAGENRLSPDLRNRVGLLQKAAIELERKRQAKAGEILASALQEEGYAVDRIDSTLFVKGGVVHVHKPGMGSDYVARIRINPATQEMRFNMVRLGDPKGHLDTTQAKRDRAMEHEWCGHLAELQKRWAKNGLSTRIKTHLAPGDIPVEVNQEKVLNPEFRKKMTQTTKAAPWVAPLKTRSL